MVLFHQIVEVLHLADADRRAVRLVVAPDGGGMGLAPIDGDRLGNPVSTDGWCATASRGVCLPGLRAQNVNRRTGRIDRPIHLPPRAFHPDSGLIHPPAAPDRACAGMARRCERRPVLHAPAGDCRVVHVDPTCSHQCVHMRRTQGGGHVPAHAREPDVLGGNEPP